MTTMISPPGGEPSRYLGKYEIKSELGRGGMGIVYRAYDASLQRTVAIKVLSPQLSADPDFVRRFQQEAVQSANLHHPNVITIHDVGTQAETHFIIMQYLEGVTLEQHVQQHGRLSLEECDRVLGQVASALDYAHDLGIIHRDIKPSNIMLSPKGQATLMDFGLVRAGAGSGLTRSGTIMGTPEYMAPEQAQEGEVDRRADIYALGVVVYKMLCGRVPFSRSTPVATIYAHVHQPPPPLREVRADLPPAVDAVIMKALAKNPRERYQTAGDLARDFDLAVRGKMPAGLQALPDAGPAGATIVAPAAAPAAPAAQRAARPSRPASAAAPAPRRGPSLPVLAGGIALALVVVIGLAWALSRPGSATPATPTTAVVLAATTPAPTSAIAATATVESPATATPVQDAGTPQPSATPAPTATPSATPTPAPPEVLVPDGAANVRAGPSDAYPIIGRLSAQDAVTITGKTEAGDWWQIKLADTDGWVSSAIVSTTISGTLDASGIAVVATLPTPVLGAGSGRTAKADGMLQLYVPAGNFLRGSVGTDLVADDNEKPQREIYLDAFWIDQTEVTNAMFARFVKATGYQTIAEKNGQSRVFQAGSQWPLVQGANWQHPFGPDSNITGQDEYPVTHMGWPDTAAYCQWAGRRLPTEAEWEKAARGTDGLVYPWGNDPPTGNLANFADIHLDIYGAEKSVDDGYEYTAPVGTYPRGASPYGALDMAGNEGEWVADRYDKAYYATSPDKNPQGPADAPARVLRSGSWWTTAKVIRTTFRGAYSGTDPHAIFGFRCAQ